MKSYVVGFLFKEDMYSATEVLLILKTHPEWQKGKLNGIGGNIETDESPRAAMEREAKEEAGIDGAVWHEYCRLSDNRTFEVFFFYAYHPAIFNAAKTQTDEEIVKYPLCELDIAPVIPNLRYLIPMALSFRRGERAKRFEVIEKEYF